MSPLKVGCVVIVVFTILIIISVRYLIKWSDSEEESLKRPIMAVICCICSAAMIFNVISASIISDSYCYVCNVGKVGNPSLIRNSEVGISNSLATKLGVTEEFLKDAMPLDRVELSVKPSKTILLDVLLARQENWLSVSLNNCSRYQLVNGEDMSIVVDTIKHVGAGMRSYYYTDTPYIMYNGVLYCVQSLTNTDDYSSYISKDKKYILMYDSLSKNKCYSMLGEKDCYSVAILLEYTG